MKFILATSTDPAVTSYEETVDLDGREYLLRIDWNAREEAWSVSVYLTDETRLALGRKIVVGFPLLFGEIDTRLPPGALMAVETTGSDAEPGIDELGRRVLFMYFDANEILLQDFIFQYLQEFGGTLEQATQTAHDFLGIS